MASNKHIAAAIIVLHEAGFFQKKRKERRWWTKNWLRRRREFSHMNLLKELRENNPDDYKNYLRMSNNEFDSLVVKVSPLIKKQDTTMRAAISVEERLAVTLRFLATGRSFEDLKFSAAISAQALGKIIPETCRAIYAALKEEYMKVN